MRTREYVESLSDEERRIRTAELCGWSDCYKQSDGLLCGIAPLDPNGIRWDSQLPDYLTDLNAMHEAEKALDFDDATDAGALKYRYAANLYNMCVPLEHQPVRATARQRNTAFLMVMLPDEGAEEQSHPSVS